MNRRLPYGPGSYPCLECGASTSITDSRPTDALGFRAIRRRRRCNGAETHRFTTFEIAEINVEAKRDLWHATMLSKAAALARELSQLFQAEESKT